MAVETLTWLGHSSFRLDVGNGTRVYVDPWLTNPNCPEDECEPERIDVIALTHGHDDHLGETTLDLCRRHRPSIVAINELSWWLEGQLGSDHDFQRMHRGGTHRVRGVRVSMTDARHSSSVWPDDSQAGFYVGEPVGFVFTWRAGRSTSRATRWCSSCSSQGSAFPATTARGPTSSPARPTNFAH